MILLALKRVRPRTQAELARAVGVSGPTLTHHLNAMESQGLVSRRPDPDNRRVQLVASTPSGDDLFLSLRDAATAHDRRLRAGLDDAAVAQLRTVLIRLAESATTRGATAPAGDITRTGDATAGTRRPPGPG